MSEPSDTPHIVRHHSRNLRPRVLGAQCKFRLFLPLVLLVLTSAPVSADTGTSRGVFVSPTTGVTIGTVWGVFVGVSQYQNRALNLTYADRDAHSLYIFFSEHFAGRISPDHFRLLINEQATRGRVLQALSETLRLAQPEDLVVISLAVHGLPDAAGNDLYFLAHDTDPNYPEDRAISQYDLIKQIQRSKARKIVLMLDACHAGSFGNFPMAMRGASSAEVNRMLTTLGQVQDGIAVLTSSSAAEQSQEGEQFCGGHGAFTCALLEGLQGKADSDRNGLVQIRELFDFTYRQVKQLTKGLQHPAIEGRYDNGLPLATTLTPEEQKLVGMPKKEMKYTDYEALKAKAEYQLKLERAWQAVDGIAKMQELPPDSRLSAINQFLQDFPEDNRYRSEAGKLVDQIRVESKQREMDQQKVLEASRAKSAKQERIDQAWKSLQGNVQQGNTNPKDRLLALNQFLEEYPTDNRYRSEAERLVQQTQQEVTKQDLQRQKQLEASRAQAAYQSKLEQSWSAVRGSAAQSTTDPENRISSINQFLQEFPNDNRHRAEAEKLVEQFQREADQKKAKDVAKVDIARPPAYDTTKDTDGNIPREITASDGAPMVLVPSGEFIMGSSAASDERPAHRVSLDSYYIDKFEVTNARYAKYMEAVTTQQSPHQWSAVKLNEDGDRPVIGVSWADAEAYCRWTGKRLPTEAEWEKAARGTDARKYPWGDEEPREGIANFGRCCGWSGFGLLAKVGTNQAGQSPYGVHDMAGNVWEWVADWYDSQYYKTSAAQNPKGPGAGRDKVIRGGSWSNRGGDVRATIRDKVPPTYRNYSIGFRCVSSVMR